MSTNTKINKVFRIITALSIFGIMLGSYLFYEYLAPQSLGVCSISETINCEPITKGSLSEIFGIPVSLIGLVGYVVIMFSSIFKNKKMVFGMTTFGMLFCLRLTILEIFVEKIICPVCVLCQITMLAIFVLSLWTMLKKGDESIVSDGEEI